MGSVRLVVVLVSFAWFASGCATTTAPPPPTPAPVAQPAVEPPSALTQGTITSRVVKGKTTQAELMELFGGPNISTVDASGVETWMYDVKSSSTNVQTQQAATVKAQAFDVFFGLGLFGSGGAQGQSSTNTNVTYSVRNLTFIIKFNPNKTVKEYSVRQSSF